MIFRNSRISRLTIVALALSACAGPGHRSFEKQLSWQDSTPVLSVQGYVINTAEDEERLRTSWRHIAEAMKNKPGFIAADLSPGVSDSGLWIEISKWEDISHLRAAFNDPEVQERVQKLPKIRMSHIFIASGGGHARRDE